MKQAAHGETEESGKENKYTTEGPQSGKMPMWKQKDVLLELDMSQRRDAAESNKGHRETKYPDITKVIHWRAKLPSVA